MLLGRESSALLIIGGQSPSTMLPLNVDRASFTACVWMVLSPRFKHLRLVYLKLPFLSPGLRFEIRAVWALRRCRGLDDLMSAS